MANVLLALVWVVTGAATVAAAPALAGRPIRLSATIVVWCLPASTLLLSCIWLALPVTAVAPTIDTARAGAIDCGSSWRSLGAGSYLHTDEGRQYAAGTGECRAAAWHRVAGSGAAEVAVAAVIGTSLVLRRRRLESTPRLGQLSSR